MLKLNHKFPEFLNPQQLTSMAEWHKPRRRVWAKTIALLVTLTFVFPYLTWAFDGVYPRPANQVGFNHQPIKISGKLGSITQSFQGDERMVVHVQDLHCNYEVQNNIAKMIDGMAKRHDLKLVTVEGASLPINVTQLSTFPLERAKKDIAHYFTKQGKITGPELYAVTGKQQIWLEGIENAQLYNNNRECVMKFLNNESQGYIFDLRETLNELKSGIYNQKLRTLDEKKQAYREGDMSLLKYCVYLYKCGDRRKVNMKAYPNLQAYAAGSESMFSRNVDSDGLFREMEELDRYLRAGLYTSQGQEDMDTLQHRLDIMEKLVNISALPRELEEFRSYPEGFKVKRFLEYIAGHDEAGGFMPDAGVYVLDRYLDEVKNFYQMADERSLVFVDNLLGRMDQHQTKLAMLVTGGFHSEKVLSEFKSRGVSYISIKPGLKHQDIVNPYFSLLRNHRTPLEKLLAQNQNILGIPSRFAQVMGTIVFKLLTKTHMKSQPKEVQSFSDELEGLKTLAGVVVNALNNPQAVKDECIKKIMGTIKVNENTDTTIVELKEGVKAVIWDQGRPAGPEAETSAANFELEGRQVAIMSAASLKKIEKKLLTEGRGQKLSEILGGLLEELAVSTVVVFVITTINGIIWKIPLKDIVNTVVGLEIAMGIGFVIMAVVIYTFKRFKKNETDKDQEIQKSSEYGFKFREILIKTIKDMAVPTVMVFISSTIAGTIWEIPLMNIVDMVIGLGIGMGIAFVIIAAGIYTFKRFKIHMIIHQKLNKLPKRWSDGLTYTLEPFYGAWLWAKAKSSKISYRGYHKLSIAGVIGMFVFTGLLTFDLARGGYAEHVWLYSLGFFASFALGIYSLFKAIAIRLKKEASIIQQPIQLTPEVERQIQEVREAIVGKLGREYINDVHHGLKHSEDLIEEARVLAREIDKEDQIDWKVLIAAICLHDIFASTQEKHGAKAAQYVEDNFKNQPLFTAEQIDKIKAAIIFHEKRTLEEKADRTSAGIEAQILYDIDNLNAFGIKGIYRYLSVYFIRGKNLAQIKNEVLANVNMRYETLSFDESRKLAHEDFLVAKSFFEKLNEETYQFERQLFGATGIAWFIKENLNRPPAEISRMALDTLESSGASVKKGHEGYKFAVDYFIALEAAYADGDLTGLEKLVPCLSSEVPDIRRKAMMSVKNKLAKIKNVTVIAFDLSGVITTDGMTLGLQKLSKKMNIEYEKLESIFFGDEYFLWAKGEIDEPEFWKRAQKTFESDYNIDLFARMPKEEIRKIWFGAYTVMPGMKEAIERLKEKGYQVILFTNSPKEKGDYVLKANKLDNVFDEIIMTGYKGFTKREKELYEILLNKAEVFLPQGILYIDDRAEFFEHPRAMGISTLLYSSLTEPPLQSNAVIREMLDGEISRHVKSIMGIEEFDAGRALKSLIAPVGMVLGALGALISRVSAMSTEAGGEALWGGNWLLGLGIGSIIVAFAGYAIYRKHKMEQTKSETAQARAFIQKIALVVGYQGKLREEVVKHWIQQIRLHRSRNDKKTLEELAERIKADIERWLEEDKLLVLGKKVYDEYIQSKEFKEKVPNEKQIQNLLEEIFPPNEKLRRPLFLPFRLSPRLHRGWMFIQMGLVRYWARGIEKSPETEEDAIKAFPEEEIHRLMLAHFPSAEVEIPGLIKQINMGKVHVQMLPEERVNVWTKVVGDYKEVKVKTENGEKVDLRIYIPERVWAVLQKGRPDGSARLEKFRYNRAKAQLANILAYQGRKQYRDTTAPTHRLSDGVIKKALRPVMEKFGKAVPLAEYFATEKDPVITADQVIGLYLSAMGKSAYLKTKGKETSEANKQIRGQLKNWLAESGQPDVDDLLILLNRAAAEQDCNPALLALKSRVERVQASDNEEMKELVLKETMAALITVLSESPETMEAKTEHGVSSELESKPLWLAGGLPEVQAAAMKAAITQELKELKQSGINTENNTVKELEVLQTIIGWISIDAKEYAVGLTSIRTLRIDGHQKVGKTVLAALAQEKQVTVAELEREENGDEMIEYAVNRGTEKLVNIADDVYVPMPSIVGMSVKDKLMEEHIQQLTAEQRVDKSVMCSFDYKRALPAEIRNQWRGGLILLSLVLMKLGSIAKQQTALSIKLHIWALRMSPVWYREQTVNKINPYLMISTYEDHEQEEMRLGGLKLNSDDPLAIAWRRVVHDPSSRNIAAQAAVEISEIRSFYDKQKNGWLDNEVTVTAKWGRLSDVNKNRGYMPCVPVAKSGEHEVWSTGSFKNMKQPFKILLPVALLRYNKGKFGYATDNLGDINSTFELMDDAIRMFLRRGLRLLFEVAA